VIIMENELIEIR